MNTSNHRTMNTKSAQTLLLAAICLPLSAWGGIDQMNRQTDVVTPIEADETDLINSGQPTLESADLPDGVALDIQILNNGITASSPDVEGIEDTSQRVWEDAREWTATFVLNTATNPSGYDITSVATIAGWSDMRANQKYEVLISKVSAPDDFLSLGEFSYAPDRGYTSITLVNESGSGALSNGTTTATGVKAIRFRILLPPGTPPPGYTEEQARLLGTAFREIDVFGVPTSAGTGPGKK
jgi:hypothetical protein